MPVGHSEASGGGADAVAASTAVSVVNPLWLDRPPAEAIEVAVEADACGHRRMWIGEMATWDAFVLSHTILTRTTGLGLVVGPLAVTVRSPMTIALGVASLVAATGRSVDVAIGSSSKVVVEQWHGRPWGGPAALGESASALRTLLDGDVAKVRGTLVSCNGYRLRLDAPRSELTVAAFGPGAIAVAAARADRMVVNLVSPGLAAVLRAQLDAATDAMGRPRLALAAWIPVAVDPSPEAVAQIAHGLVSYLAAPGYADMFTAAGFGELVQRARAGTHPRELFAAVPRELVETVSALGDRRQVVARLDEFRAAGVDEVAIVPATAGDPRAARTLAALAPGS